jgi:hypothetical protein
MPIVPHTWRLYRCRNCGNEQHISTNHHGACFDYCRGCSWKPSFGEHGVRMFGRMYRPFDYVRELDHAAETQRRYGENHVAD